MQVILLPEALTDLDSAIEWYNEQEPDLGLDLYLEFQNTLGHIQEFPDAYPEKFDEYRQALTDRFPYKIFYRLDEDSILIYAVLHHHQNIDQIIKDRFL